MRAVQMASRCPKMFCGDYAVFTVSDQKPVQERVGVSPKSSRNFEDVAEWLKPCMFMIHDGYGRRDLSIFLAYALGSSVSDIAKKHMITRQYANKLLNRIFSKIDEEATRLAFSA